MKKLYEKKEVWFAVACIVIYVIIMGNMRANFGDESPASMLALLAMVSILNIFIIKNNLTEKYGLVKVKNAKKYLFFIPFVLLCTVNLWFGANMNFDPGHQLIAVLTMILAAYLEEMLFRGLLFKAMEKNNVKSAIIVSALTFGVGHIVNLFTGEATLDTLLQVAYAIAIGFSFALCFYKSGSLVPCIVTHAIINGSSKFISPNYGGTNEVLWNCIGSVFVIVVAGGYAIYLKRKA